MIPGCARFLVLSTCVLTLQIHAQDDGIPSIYLGMGGGLGAPGGPPSIRSGIFGEIQGEVRASDRIWLSLGLGGLFTASNHDPDFDMILFHARISIQYDLPLDLPDHTAVFVKGGPILQDFDPVGPVDAEDNLIRIGVHAGGGVWHHLYDKVRLTGFLRMTTVSTDVMSFPISAATRGSSGYAFHIYLGTMFTVKF